jgi:large subunit ribosomal protein L21
VAGGKVEAKVVRQGRGDKVSVIKFKRRTTYKRMKTHRQSFTLVEITGISGGPAAE